MEKEKEIVTLSDGREITITENDWGMSRKLNRLSDEMKAELTDDSKTSALGTFKRDFYPLLAAVSEFPSLGVIMSPEDAYALPHTDLDNWYMAVWRMNPDWFSETAPKIFDSELVALRDGSTVELVESKGRPSFILRLAQLEENGMLYPKKDDDERMFQVVFYPKMAGCSIGKFPDEDTMRAWPTAEINKVYEAAKRKNPAWFFALDAISERARESEEKKRG